MFKPYQRIEKRKVVTYCKTNTLAELSRVESDLLSLIPLPATLTNTYGDVEQENQYIIESSTQFMSGPLIVAGLPQALG